MEGVHFHRSMPQVGSNCGWEGWGKSSGYPSLSIYRHNMLLPVAIESVEMHPSMAAQCGYGRGGGSVAWSGRHVKKNKREEGWENVFKTTITKSFFFTSIFTRKRLAAELHSTRLGSLKRSIIFVSTIVDHTL